MKIIYAYHMAHNISQGTTHLSPQNNGNQSASFLSKLHKINGESFKGVLKMYKHIMIEDLAANALITLLEYKDIRRVSFRTLVDYGMQVVKVLEQNGEDALLFISYEYKARMLRSYSDFFKIEDGAPEEEFIVLKEGKTVDDLWLYFRGALTEESLKAYTSDEVLAVLGIAG
jgi:hypothetical protein